ncbi:conserved hypothetical protein [delta proteobacterium NaphS2]|nr:conserved hypothetical protein [delta proteobacterium NaphS2]
MAGNPPIKFAGADFELENEAQHPATFSLFLGRVFLNDLFGIGFLRSADVLAYAVLYTLLLRLGAGPVMSALLALIFTEFVLVLSGILTKKALVGSRWGSNHKTPFWSWRHFMYFFAQDCFFAWCRIPLRVLAGTVLSNTILRRMGCRIGKRTILASPMQAFDWNAVNFGDDCYISGLLQFHTLENMTLKVKETRIRNGCTVNSGVTLMGGAVMENATTLLPLCMVLKEMHLPTGTYWGSPAEPYAGNQDLSCCDIALDAGLKSKCSPEILKGEKRPCITCHDSR